jgi:hypothetical protein
MTVTVLAKPCLNASILKKKMRQQRLGMSLLNRLERQAANAKSQVSLAYFAVRFAVVFFALFCVGALSACTETNQSDIKGKSKKKAKNEKCKIKALPHKIGYVVVCTSFFYEAHARMMSGLRGCGVGPKSAPIIDNSQLLLQMQLRVVPHCLYLIKARHRRV